MKNQLRELSFSFDWNRVKIINFTIQNLDQNKLKFYFLKELSTCHESYYRWTQHLFLQLYLKGIVVRKEVNF